MRSILVQVPTPCHERWGDMQPVERGRFCANCQKTVVDYSLLSDKELIKALSKPLETTCGRFRNEQLDRPLVPANHRITSAWRNWVSLFTLSLVSWQSAWAQRHSVNQSLKPASTQQPSDRLSYSASPIATPKPLAPDATWLVSGRIMCADSSGNLSPVAAIDVSVSGIITPQLVQRWTAKTDSSGAFHIAVPRQEQPATLKIWPFADKYILKTIQVDANPTAATITVGDIIIRRVPPRKDITGGGMCVIQTPSPWQKLKRKLFR